MPNTPMPNLQPSALTEAAVVEMVKLRAQELNEALAKAAAFGLRVEIEPETFTRGLLGTPMRRLSVGVFKEL